MKHLHKRLNAEPYMSVLSRMHREVHRDLREDIYRKIERQIENNTFNICHPVEDTITMAIEIQLELEGHG